MRDHLNPPTAIRVQFGLDPRQAEERGMAVIEVDPRGSGKGCSRIAGAGGSAAADPGYGVSSA